MAAGELAGTTQRIGDAMGLMKQRITALLAGLVALFGMSSCIEVDQTINLKKDGSGTITEEVVMGAQMLAMMEGGLGGLGGEAGADPLADLYDEAKYKEKAAAYGEGVTFTKLEKIQRNGGKGVKVTYTFKDINKVQFSPGSAMDDIGPGNEGGGEEDPVTFQYAGGVLTVNFPDIDAGDAGAADLGGEDLADPAAEAMMAQMAQMFKDMKISAKLNVVGGIAETDATHVDGNTVTLLEMVFAEIIKNPEGMKALQKMEGADRGQMQELLKDVKGVKVETKEKIKVKLK